MSPILDDEFDLNRIIIKPLYLGLVVNVLVPMAILLVCYFLDKNQSWFNRIGEGANTLFYAIVAVSLAQAAVALWWRTQMMKKPMVRSKETFEDDLVHSLVARSKPIFYLIALIALWGFAYFYFTARFEETLMIVLFSFVVFQVVRPRFGFARSLIKAQKELVEKGVVIRD
ncbi:MAG: hypothetical protein AB1483_00050 [Candidatus Zixiibacteriota bacterium]